MAKRKISDYYRSTKKRRGGPKRKVYASHPNYKHRGRYNTKRRMGRRTRYGRKTKTSRIRTTYGNLRNITQQVADRVIVANSTGTAGNADNIGKRCTWLYSGVNSPNFDYGLGCMAHITNMASIAEVDENSAFLGQVVPETKFQVKDSQAQYDITNCSDASSKLTVYHCTVKRDVVNVNSNYNFVSMLGDGYFQRGLITGGRGQANQGLIDAAYTPFHSHKFCSYVHVGRVETIILDPGQVCKRTVKTGSYSVNMSHYTTSTAVGQTSGTATLDYSHRRGEKFLLIKVEGQAANDSANSLSFTSPAIDMITTLSYTFQAINRQAPTLTTFGAINFKIPTTVQIMEDETGAVIPQANA